MLTNPNSEWIQWKEVDVGFGKIRIVVAILYDGEVPIHVKATSDGEKTVVRRPWNEAYSYLCGYEQNNAHP